VYFVYRYRLVAASGFTLLAAAATASTANTETAYVYNAPSRSASTTTSTSSSNDTASTSTPSPVPTTVAHTPTPRIIFVLGGPGAGKGTQCGKLVKEYGFVHLSAGDLLRDERDSGSPDGEMIENFIREGKIVPVEVTINLIRKAMNRSGATKFLIDGFPRNFNNLEGWNSVMKDQAIVDGVLFYEVDEDVLVKRLLKRAETSGRSDDNIDSILKRLHTYNQSTVPVLEHFSKQGKVTRIFGGDPVDVVFSRTSAAVEPVITNEVLGYNRLLLDAISYGDWSAYEALTDLEVTCFEPEASGLGLVKGYEFHKNVFEASSKARAEATAAGKSSPLFISTMHQPEVRLLGPKHALITYTRLISSSDNTNATSNVPVTRVNESRVWKLSNGKWKMIHFHRSKC